MSAPRLLASLLAAALALIPAGRVAAEVDASPSAQWIWSPPKGPADTWLCLRATVQLDAVPKSVPARIAADSTYWLWINGVPVVTAGGLKRGPTPSDTYADALDLAPCLKPGRNTLAALVWFWGRDGSSHLDSGQGGFLLQTPLAALDTGVARWRFHPQTAFGHGLPKPPLGVRPESPVVFDARDDLPGWQGIDFDDSAWPAAVAKGAPPAAPWGKLVARPIPFFRASEPRAYLNAAALALPREGPVTLTARLPANLQLYPRFTVVARAGLNIVVQAQHAYEPATYVTRDGAQTFEVPAWSNGECVTYRFPAGVHVLKIDYRETGYDADLAGVFRCSDPALETLWQKCARSVYVNLRDTYMDCPDRERSAWPGDLANASAAASFVLDRRADALTAKCLREFLNWQAPDGVLWGAVPTGRFRGAYREIPAQSLALIAVGFPNYVRQTGDLALAREAAPKIRRYLLACWSMDADGLPRPRPSRPGWGAGTDDWMDWGEPPIDRRLLETAWYSWALQGIDFLQKSAGLPDDREVSARRASIAAAFDRVFWDAAAKAYRSPGFAGPPDDRGNGVAVCAGLTPARRDADLAAFLSRRRASSIYMERYPVDALFILKRPDLALARLEQRYRAAINSPVTTLPEMFGASGLQTNHAWGAWPAATLARRVAGVRPESPGYAAFAVEPAPGDLKSFELRFPSVRGEIGVRWERTGAGATLAVHCPAGSVADVVLPPLPGATTITCNGAPAQPVAGDPARFRIEAGDWLFAIR